VGKRSAKGFQRDKEEDHPSISSSITEIAAML